MPRSVTLSFELLQTFVSLIRHEGREAAVMRELDLNQPTLSKRLKYLQHAGTLLDRPWLVREGKTWKLTDEGRRVWPAVVSLVDRCQNLHTFVEDGGKASGAAPGLTVRPLARDAFAQTEAKLICRRLAGSGAELDLSEMAQSWLAILRSSAGR